MESYSWSIERGVNTMEHEGSVVVSSTENSESTAWLDKDRQYMWHHMSPYKASQNPLVAAEGSGAWIQDLDGNRYFDAMSGLWCVNLGYSETELAEAAYEQLKKMPFFP